MDKFDLCQGARQLAKDLDFFIRWRCIEPERPIEIGAVRSKSRPRRQLLAQFLQQELFTILLRQHFNIEKEHIEETFNTFKGPLSFRNQPI